MRTIEVVAAIIRRDGLWFATQRGYGVYEGLWEFPGGKINDGESPEEALRREIREELAMEISVGERLCTIEHDYPDFHLKMHCFLCTIIENIDKCSQDKSKSGCDGTGDKKETEIKSDCKSENETKDEAENNSVEGDRGKSEIEPTLIEAKSARWLTSEELPTVEWLPADWKIIPYLRQ